MVYFLFVLPFFLLLVFVTRIFTVFFHELGHAIPAILLTRQKVTVFIGSYGDPENSFRLNMGLLEIWFRSNLLYWWREGLCVPSAKEISINKNIFYTFCGPVASLLIAITAGYFAFAYDMHGAFKLFMAFLLVSAILDLFMNLIPNHRQIMLYDGKMIYNDGHQLQLLIYFKTFPARYEKAVGIYNRQDYKNAAGLFDDFLNRGLEHEQIYRLAIASFLMIKKYEKALSLHKSLEGRYALLANDYVNSGLARMHLGLSDESFSDFNKSLELEPDNLYALNNKGYMLTLMEQYAGAIPYLDKAISIDPLYAYAYNNRGFAKIKTGKTEEGLHDIQKSLQLDPGNSYVYKNLGIYHLDRDEKEEALAYFTKARELNKDTLLIDGFIAQANALQGQGAVPV